MLIFAGCIAAGEAVPIHHRVYVASRRSRRAVMMTAKYR